MTLANSPYFAKLKNNPKMKIPQKPDVKQQQQKVDIFLNLRANYFSGRTKPSLIKMCCCPVSSERLTNPEKTPTMIKALTIRYKRDAAALPVNPPMDQA